MQGMHYRAIDQHGQVHTGFSSGSSSGELEHWLDQRGWQALPLSKLQQLFSLLQLRPLAPSWSKTSAGLFTLNFSQLLGAGVPLLQALEEISNLERNPLLRRALSDVHARVDQGESLSDALSTCPDLFGRDYVASVQAGESSGKLPQCLELQAANLQWQAELTSRLKTVLAYPLFALVSLLVVLLFVLLYLVPAMQPLLSMNTAALPAHTRVLLSFSSLLQESGFAVLFFLCSLFGLLACLFQFMTPVRRALQSLALKGSYGQIIAYFSLARYARTTGLLYEAGIEITDAMRIAEKLVSNRLLQMQLNQAHQLVLGGASLGSAMQAQADFPTLFVRMVVAGERAGVLGVALRQCADQLQSNGQYALDRVERLIGPVLLCAMGAVLLWVAVSVLGPIYGTISQVGVGL